jgi:hypothetical protein
VATSVIKMHRKFFHGEEKTVLYRNGKSIIMKLIAMISEEGQEFMENIQKIIENIPKFMESILKFMESIPKFMESIQKFIKNIQKFMERNWKKKNNKTFT